MNVERIKIADDNYSKSCQVSHLYRFYSKLFLSIFQYVVLTYGLLRLDDVWLQGLQINRAKDVVVNVDKNIKNAKLIDMTFVGGLVPEGDSAASAGVVLGEANSHLEVLQSSFKWNQATPVFSRGSLIVYDSYFEGNRGTKVCTSFVCKTELRKKK